MKSNFNFQISTNVNSRSGNQKSKKDALTPQEEYWLNRILRDHSVQIFITAALFLILMIIAVIIPLATGNSYNNSQDINLINISR